MGAIITFSASLGAIALLLLIKDWELRRHKKLFFLLRTRLNTAVLSFVSRLGTKTPELASSIATRTKISVRHGLALSLHTLLVRVEQGLERTLRVLRYQRIKTTRTVSPFLQDVAEHKRSLDKSGV